jgi:hypothetical protein
MTTSPISEQLPLSRKAEKAKIRREKALDKIKRKEQVRKKAEYKLAEKEERRIAHKKANAQQKFEKKLKLKKESIKKS